MSKLQPLNYALIALATTITDTQAAATLNRDPSATQQPAPSYSKPGMAAYNFMMDDPLLGNNYEEPIWNLHDALHLPDWLSVGVEQRTRYQTITDTSKGSYGYKDNKKQYAHASQGGDQLIDRKSTRLNSSHRL